MPAPEGEGSKRDRLYASFDAMLDADVARTANLLIEHGKVSLSVRNRLQDLLWMDDPCPVIPLRFRRELAASLQHVSLYGNARRFDELLRSLWIIEYDPWADLLGRQDNSLAAEIDRHVFRNPDDWTVDHLFDQLGAYDASDQRFVRFIEGMATGDVQPDATDQREFVESANRVLTRCGAHLRETGVRNGYPEYSLVSLYSASGSRPKNIIFASSSKPDLRFRDAINNDVEIVTNADKVLIYDRPIGNDGVRWQDLQAWWSESQGIENDDRAKASLYKRLKSCLPENSPPQHLLFVSFFEAFRKAAPRLPALLPEVWLHWDPQTVRERGADALLRFRMDFLLLLPHGIRVVIEVDGMHHYGNPDTRQADAHRYAQMAAADRDLKLAGYEVYRFGASELLADTAQANAIAFFHKLFRRYNLAW
ncbi:hypothetical protein B7759_03075 [Burkholderia glumae]|uniref:AbiJ-related protein n=2 Tax=Burkholderiaceae TaxID=119060 RepID=UPI001BB4C627|nr:hypothetical protein [Burkholderia glumae]QKM52897.1 hypothetical protein CG017_00891 [Burkholderia glumae]QTP34466.1 hypothetical protein B7759_03075 [Burkholderia glumae]